MSSSFNTQVCDLPDPSALRGITASRRPHTATYLTAPAAASRSGTPNDPLMNRWPHTHVDLPPAPAPMPVAVFADPPAIPSAPPRLQIPDDPDDQMPRFRWRDDRSPDGRFLLSSLFLSSPEQELIVRLVREFVERGVMPVASAMEHRDNSSALVRQMIDIG
jgi:hypothetical protein